MTKLNRQQLPKLMEEVTYSELVELRNNSKLIPGLWYRITDYWFYTKVNKVKSGKKQFDVLVQAVSENELSEDAKACLHKGDQYFAKNHPDQLNFEILDFDWSECQPVYDLYVDSGVVYDTIDPRIDRLGELVQEHKYHSEDIFANIEWGVSPMTGTTVPVIYKYDSEYDPEYVPVGSADYEDPFYYVKDMEVGGITYNVWAKYTYGGSEFAGVYILTPVIVKVVGSVRTDITWYYDIFTDNGLGSFYGRGDIDDDPIVKVVTVEDEEGTVEDHSTDIVNHPEDRFSNIDYGEALGGPFAGMEVPVLFKDDPLRSEDLPIDGGSRVTTVDWGDPFYYYGEFTFEDKVYDLWAKWDTGGADEFLFKHYSLTNKVVNIDTLKFIKDEQPEFVYESDLDAWEIKYCLDNDTRRFSWAYPNGHGVIYYMKDEHNNEATYDFKNALFARYGAYDVYGNIFPSWDIVADGYFGSNMKVSSDSEHYYYTFNYHKWYPKDASVESKKFSVHDNKVLNKKTFYYYEDFYSEGLYTLALPNVVLISEEPDGNGVWSTNNTIINSTDITLYYAHDNFIEDSDSIFIGGIQNESNKIIHSNGLALYNVYSSDFDLCQYIIGESINSTTFDKWCQYIRLFMPLNQCSFDKQNTKLEVTNSDNSILWYATFGKKINTSSSYKTLSVDVGSGNRLRPKYYHGDVLDVQV